MATRTANTGSNNWNTNAAWVGGVQPTAADDVIIPASAVITIPTATTVQCRSLTVQASGTLVFTNSTSCILNIGDGTAGASNVAISISATATITIGGSAVINLISTSTTQQTINSGGKTLPTLVINGTGSSYILSAALTMSVSITLTAGTFNTGNFAIACTTFNYGNNLVRTLTLGSSVITCSGAASPFTGTASTNLTVTANTASVICSGAVTGSNNVFVLSGKDWNGLSFTVTGGGQGSLNLGSASARIKDLTITGTAAQTNSYRLSHDLTLTGAFTVSGNSTINRVLVFGINPGTANIITAATVSLLNVDFMDITGAGTAAPFTGTTLGDRQGNSGITFTPAATQTFGGASGNWNDASKWTSRVPLPQDDVIINASSGNITGTGVLCMGKNIDFTGYTGTITHTSNTSNYSVYGSLTISSDMSFGPAVSAFSLEYRGRGTHTITCAGKTLFPATSTANHTITAPGGVYSLNDTFTLTSLIASSLLVLSGTFNTLNNTLSIGSFNSNGVLTRVIDFGTSAINLQSTGGVTLLRFTTTGLTLSATDATFTVIQPTASTRSLDLGGAMIGTLNYIASGSTGPLNISSSAIISNLNFYDANNARTLGLSAGVTLAILSAFNVYGTVGKLVTIQSNTAGSRAFLSKPIGGPISTTLDYLSIRDIHMVQPLSFFAGSNCTDVSNNSGIYFGTASTFKHQQSAAATTTGTSVSVSLSLAATAGNLLLMYVQSAGTTGTVSAPSGFTLAATIAQSATGFIYYKVASGSESTITYGQATSRTLVASVAEYTGFSGIPTLDGSSTNSTASSATSLATTSSAGPTNTDQPALAVALWGSTATMAAIVSVTNDFHADYTIGNASTIAHTAVKEITAVAPVSSTLTWTTARANDTAIMAIFKNVVTSNGNFFPFF